ncbi:MAG: DUF2384 domain-containing protein [Chlorobia bacterium]|nr:DUF2384 domain-containing protein [Fimbriimonadaceae bacterium]
MDAALIQSVILRLGGSATLGRKVRDLNGLRVRIESGLPTKSIDHVLTGVGNRTERAELRNKIVPRSTLARRGDTLTQEESERLERVARVISLAEQTWEGEEQEAWKFLNRAHPELDGLEPIDVALTEIGARQVEELLQKIEYGLPV